MTEKNKIHGGLQGLAEGIERILETRSRRAVAHKQRLEDQGEEPCDFFPDYQRLTESGLKMSAVFKKGDLLEAQKAVKEYSQLYDEIVRAHF